MGGRHGPWYLWLRRVRVKYYLRRAVRPTQRESRETNQSSPFICGSILPPNHSFVNIARECCTLVRYLHKRVALRLFPEAPFHARVHWSSAGGSPVSAQGFQNSLAGGWKPQARRMFVVRDTTGPTRLNTDVSVHRSQRSWIQCPSTCIFISDHICHWGALLWGRTQD